MIIHDVEQNTEEWIALRLGIPTASEFSKIITAAGKPSKSLGDYAITLANEVYAGQRLDAWQGNSHTERGHELEDEAIALYELSKNTDVQRVGFVTDDKQSVGCSPDGLIDKDGLVEVKCLSSKEHTKAIIRHQRDGSYDPKYFQQCQGQMMICGRKWVDLLFYHDILPNLVIRIYDDDEFHICLSNQLCSLIERRNEVLSILRD